MGQVLFFGRVPLIFRLLYPDFIAKSSIRVMVNSWVALGF